ncbi:hypothetical protein CKAN_01100000 [Cinnamomum micranthum f. kanehirae]|uniref:Uncharacterized protein n=1 Tax=Cinnamomum micranthum f. kanehirae TaxID=337451 RepID=A0A443NUV4_9MAGN|nr:hypothetical protein CKAN_01100000 [Cinnamomum micranthum f. kanehirae]
MGRGVRIFSRVFKVIHKSKIGLRGSSSWRSHYSHHPHCDPPYESSELLKNKDHLVGDCITATILIETHHMNHLKNPMADGVVKKSL